MLFWRIVNTANMEDDNKASYTYQSHKVCPKRVLGIDSLRLLALLSLNPFPANHLTYNVSGSIDKRLQTRKHVSSVLMERTQIGPSGPP